MTKKTFFFLLILFIVALLVSCGENSSVLVDGYYSAETAAFDSYGWKEYLTICVSNGRIIFVEYNSFNAAGLIKSWDMDYMRQMNAESGTYPNAFTRYYSRLFLENQGIDGIEALSGASYSYPVFIALAKAVLASAGEGNKKTVQVHTIEEE
jgi:major membrane immunogen (membrane-anchored lipoprotein)